MTSEPFHDDYLLSINFAAVNVNKDPEELSIVIIDPLPVPALVPPFFAHQTLLKEVVKVSS